MYHLKLRLTCLLFVYATITSVSLAQVQTLSLSPEHDGVFFTESLTVDTTATILDPDQVWSRLMQRDTRGDHYHGFVQDYVWAGITLQNNHAQHRWILELQNPHINHIHVYTRNHEDEQWILHSHTGRATVFNSRSIPHFNFVFDLFLPQSEQTDVLFLLDKRRSSLNYPLRVWTQTSFMNIKDRSYAFIGMYFGVFGIIFFITLVTFVITQRGVYFWYLCYVATLALFIFTDIGLAQQFIYPESTTLGGNTRLYIAYTLLITFNAFTISYFDTRNTFTVLHHVLVGLSLMVFSIAAVHVVFLEWTQTHATAVIILFYALVVTSILIAIIIAVRYIQIERFTAYIFITAFSFVLLAGVLFILAEFGVTNRPNLLFTPLQIGSVLEIILLSIGLAWQVRVVEQKRQHTLQKIRILENKNLRAYIDGTERERIRVAMDLHDNIGSKLGQLRRNVEKKNIDTQAISGDIQDIVEDLRFISHKLSPQGLRITGLEDSIQYLVSNTHKNSRIHYTLQIVDLPKDMSETVTVQLFRIIQEAIQNIEKHSEAERADIQLICHDTELVLTIEDNGKGFPEQDVDQQGIGLQNIKKRVAILGGEVSFFSRPGNGVSIVIQVPK